jgi:beta-glucosidase
MLKPRYPFGYGLSYTTFAITGASVKPLGNNTYTLTAKVKNTGTRAGEEVVQAYVSDQNPGVDKPVKELKAFSKVMIQPGETKEVTLFLPQRAFMYFNAEKMNWFAEPGKYSIMLGNSSQNMQQTVYVTIK